MMMDSEKRMHALFCSQAMNIQTLIQHLSFFVFVTRSLVDLSPPSLHLFSSGAIGASCCCLWPSSASSPMWVSPTSCILFDSPTLRYLVSLGRARSLRERKGKEGRERGSGRERDRERESLTQRSIQRERERERERERCVCETKKYILQFHLFLL